MHGIHFIANVWELGLFESVNDQRGSKSSSDRLTHRQVKVLFGSKSNANFI